MNTKKCWYVYGENSISSSGDTFYTYRVFRIFTSENAANVFLENLRKFTYDNRKQSYFFDCEKFDSFDIEESELCADE